MIGRLTGEVVEESPDGACVLDVHGVGYEVFVPLGALGRGATPGTRVTLHVHTHVREDTFTLYGFPTLEDRAAFRAMLGVSGVGPKTALAVLGALPCDDLARAIARGDKARFKGIHGVGKKTVDRLVLELKDKLPARTAAEPAPSPAAPVPDDGPLAVVSAALMQMGYKPAEAERAVATIRAVDGRPIDVLLREALRGLS